MIIVSQNEEEVINFDLVAEILVVGNSIVISNNIMKFSGQEIGKYNSEQRAKEVLDDIIKRIVMSERFAATCDIERQSNIIGNSYDKNEPLFIYQMPKE